MVLELPAAAYPDEGMSGTIPCHAAFRQKIIDSVAMRESNNLRLLKPYIEKTTVTLSTVMTVRGPALDRIDSLLSRDDIDWPDPAQPHPGFSPCARYADTPSDVFYLFFNTDLVMPLALHRAELEGDPDRIAKLLVGLVRMDLIAHFHYCAYPWRTAPVSMPLLDEFFFSAGEAGPNVQKGLEQAADLLARSKLDDKQAVALRAMWVMGQREFITNPELQMIGIGSKIEMMAIRLGCEARWALLAPIASGWADGDDESLQYGINRLESLSNLQERIFNNRLDDTYQCYFPTHFSGSSGDAAYNYEVERLQILVAMARFRLASGRYPEDIHELVPRYFDLATIEHKNSAWGIARLPAGIYPPLNTQCESDAQHVDIIKFQSFVESYRKAHGRLPQSAADLRPFGADDAFIAAHADWFTPLAEHPILFSVQRVHLRRAELKRALSYGSCELSSNPDEIQMGPRGLPVLRIIAYWPEPEQYWPEIRGLIKKGNRDSRF